MLPIQIVDLERICLSSFKMIVTVEMIPRSLFGNGSGSDESSSEESDRSRSRDRFRPGHIGDALD